MPDHNRIESRDLASFVTTRCRNSEMWYLNNLDLNENILTYLARYRRMNNVKLYAIAIEGNHIHIPAHFPDANRADFARNFNRGVTRAVQKYCHSYPGGPLQGRRYSNELLGGNEDIEEYFFYTVLQPVKDLIVEDIKDYPGYNCFEDAITGRVRPFKYFREFQYNGVCRRRKVENYPAVEEYEDDEELFFTRLPGYEDLSQAEYEKMMREKLRVRTEAIVKKAKEEGKKFLGAAGSMALKPGTKPKKTKKPTGHRPRILCASGKRYAILITWYFKVYKQYKAASEAYRKGQTDVEFPAGTYKPYGAKNEAPKEGVFYEQVIRGNYAHADQEPEKYREPHEDGAQYEQSFIDFGA